MAVRPRPLPPPASLLLTAAFALAAAQAHCQSPFTRADTLRGALRPERTAYDVLHYALDLSLDLSDSSISGAVTVAYRGLFAEDTLQLDLAAGLDIHHIEQGGRALGYHREYDAVFVGLDVPTAAGRVDTLTVAYSGKPRIAVSPPWDGGLTWARDTLGRPWISVSCEGLGASAWWPNKDHLSDEPDSVSFSLTVPSALDVVGNGRRIGDEPLPGGRHRVTYATHYPINTYNVTFYVGHYATFSDTLQSVAYSTPLPLNYAVLDYNEARAREHFAQVKPMLRCYEDIVGPYPFPVDGYRLVEAPYLGMEHQSAIAYGNGFTRGYLGGMIPDDMDWDYLIVHESGHEYFGNALSVEDHAEMWLHESFTTYLEALYVECRYGRRDYLRYLLSQRPMIRHQFPLIGPTGVNFTDFPDSDIYFRGAWVLHTFRTQVGDAAFAEFLRDWFDAHSIGSVTTGDWLAAVRERFGEEYDAFWRQYLYEASPPKLDVREARGGSATVRIADALPGFSLIVDVEGVQYTLSEEPTSLPTPGGGLAELTGALVNGYLVEATDEPGVPEE